VVLYVSAPMQGQKRIRWAIPLSLRVGLIMAVAPAGLLGAATTLGNFVIAPLRTSDPDSNRMRTV
jgi:hypothetical protein